MTYQREYYLSADRRFRLTADWHLSYSGIRPDRSWGAERKDHSVVLEIKYQADDDDDLDSAFGGLPLRLARNSKYVNAMLATA